METTELVTILTSLASIGMLYVTLRKLAPETKALEAAAVESVAGVKMDFFKLVVAELRTSVAEEKATRSELTATVETMRRESMEKDVKHDKEIADLQEQLAEECKKREKLERELEAEREKRRQLEEENKKLRARVKTLEEKKEAA